MAPDSVTSTVWYKKFPTLAATMSLATYDVVIVGSGQAGTPLASAFAAAGRKIALIEKTHVGGTCVNEECTPSKTMIASSRVAHSAKNGGIKVHLLMTATSISSTGDKRGHIILETDPSPGSILASHILLATGRMPNTDLLHLGRFGVKTNRDGYVIVNERLETTSRGTYAPGDVQGGPVFTHMSCDDFRIIRTYLLRGSVPRKTPSMTTTIVSRSRALLPYVIYTEPQLAHVGFHDRDLGKTQRKTKTPRMSMEHVATVIETGETRGFMKATIDAEIGNILGFTCLGIEGGELMAVVQTAMMGNVEYWDFEAAVWAHPSLAESLNSLWGDLQ